MRRLVAINSPHFGALMVLLLAAALATGLLALVGTKPASAAFPGQNGKIAVVSTRDGGDNIFVMDSNGSSPTNLTNNSLSNLQPAFSPDGTKIAFQSFRGFDGEIYVMGSNGSNPTNLTNNGSNDGVPTFSPDGAKIAFVSSRNGGQNDIYVMRSSGSSNPTNLTNTTSAGSNEGKPAFSSDGTKIAFERDNEIYVMGSDGSNPTNLTNNRFGDSYPDLGVAVNTPPNTPPVATGDSYNANQDQTLNVPASSGVLANDTDPDNDPLTAVKDTDPSNGTLALNSDGSFTYTPNSGFTGTDSFTYKANDGTNDSDVATVTITVQPDTTPPTVVSVSPAENAPGVGRATNITITFSEAMKTSSFDANTVKLTRGITSIPFTMTTSTDSSGRTVLTLDPFGSSSTQKLAKRKTYTVTVEGTNPPGDTFAVKDAAGNEMTQDKIWSFKTGRK